MSQMFDKISLIATCAFGLESEVSYELRQLGYEEQKKKSGRVMFDGDFSAMARANMWLRTSERVRWCLGEFKATTFTELYDKVKALPWGDIMEENAAFPVDGNSVRSQLASVPAIQRIAKKAVVDAMAQKYSVSTLPETGVTYRIRVSLLDDIVTVALDTSGVGLHKRGYRGLAYEAPMKETLAAALVRFSRWKGDRLLVDPFCGSGTILLEAAMIARNMAPGLKRSFAAEDWNVVPETVFREARAEAEDLADRYRKLQIVGSDLSLKAVDLSKHHARELGLDDCITFSRMDVADFLSPESNGVLLCNPPYGERIGDFEEACDHIRVLGDLFNRHRDWSFYVISPAERFEMYFGKQASKRRKLYNGRIKCNLYSYFGTPLVKDAPAKGMFKPVRSDAKPEDYSMILDTLSRIPLQKVKRIDIPADTKKHLFSWMTAKDSSLKVSLVADLIESLKAVDLSVFNDVVPSVDSSVSTVSPNEDVVREAGKLDVDHMRLERWRDGLIADLPQFTQNVEGEFPKADVAHIRKLCKMAREEDESNAPPRSKRKLFRYLRSVDS